MFTLHKKEIIEKYFLFKYKKRASLTSNENLPFLNCISKQV